MSSREIYPGWGQPPWKIDFTPRRRRLPKEVDFAIIGGGFTGLAAAAWLRHLAPDKSVAVFEAGRIGAGASGRTGGMVLADTAPGKQRGLGDVLAGFQSILKRLRVRCDLSLSGAWEIGRSGSKCKDSPISWEDSGTLRVTKEVLGGTLDPGKLVSGLGRAAERAGALIAERQPVQRVSWNAFPELEFAAGKLHAKKILFAMNAMSLDLSGLGEDMHPRLTLAALTAPVSERLLAAVGLAARKPFYTVDFPYLWGRVLKNNSVMFGAGLVASPDENDLAGVDIASAEPARMFDTLEGRVRRMHPALANFRFTRRWGGPILFRDNWTPVFDWHPASRNAIVLGAYAGHGVALSSYLAAWAAEALLGRRELPAWGAVRVAR
ncbi:MAG: FAD-dependent oxidoreductase [Candidatus Acidiferrales bacterium]